DTTMTSNSSYSVQGEHDEVMTVCAKSKKPQLNTFTSHDPLVCSAQTQVATSLTKEKTLSHDISIFSNENEKDIDNLDDQELIKFLSNVMKENKSQNTNVHKERIDHQTQQNSVKDWQIDNKTQTKDIAKVDGTHDTPQQEDKGVVAYLAIPSYSSQNPTNLVLTQGNFAQFIGTQGNLQNPEIVLTSGTATQNVNKEEIPCSNAAQIVLNTGNITQVVQKQRIPVQSSVLFPAQPLHVKKDLPQVHLLSDTTVKTPSLCETTHQQTSKDQICNKQIITKNTSKISSPNQKRSHQEVDDDDDKDIQMKKKSKVNNTNINKRIKKWEIEGELMDPIEEQKRLNAKKAHDHRMKEKREKEVMKTKIKFLEDRVKDLESKVRVLNAENVLLRSLKIGS
ncbi:unnamed protein product, partial [Meganyctiphanes norvegica]